MRLPRWASTSLDVHARTEEAIATPGECLCVLPSCPSNTCLSSLVISLISRRCYFLDVAISRFDYKAPRCTNAFTCRNRNSSMYSHDSHNMRLPSFRFFMAREKLGAPVHHSVRM